MKQTQTHLDTLKLVGITTVTCNSAEMDPETSKIEPLINQYFTENLGETIPQRVTPGTLYCAYTNYASDEQGEYTYFVGEKVDAFESIPSGLTTLTIPASDYVKLESDIGPMPHVCIEAWEKIWAMTPADLGGERTYITDFEVYDERADDPENTILDIYIGIRSENK